MAEPKRHHWWPQLQSGYWTGSKGLINVTKSDGSVFKASPKNIGVEGELYTRFDFEDQKDLTIEQWFANEVEGPFDEALKEIVALDNIRRSPLPEIDPDRVRNARELGFLVPRYVEDLELSPRTRGALDRYLAALLVRNPHYLSKLVDYHDSTGAPLPADIPRTKVIKSLALDNMLTVYEIYAKAISRSDVAIVVASGSNEFLFADSGITAQEPWKKGPMPFEIHAPMTPRISVEVIPLPGSKRRNVVLRINNHGTARMNRIVLGSAKRFIFSREKPPIKFITRYFGQPAPKPFGHRMRDGQIETTYDRSRDRY